MFYKCTKCSEYFSRKQYLVRHQREVHQGESVKHYTYEHKHLDLESCKSLPKVTVNDITRIVSASAFNNTVRSLIFFSENTYLPCNFFEHLLFLLEETINCLKKVSIMKINSTLCIQFSKLSDMNVKDNAYFSTSTKMLDEFNSEDVFQELKYKIERYTNRGSQWIITNTLFFELKTTCIK